MTSAQVHNAIKQKTDKTSGLSLASFEDEEIDFWVNDAINTFKKQRYGGLNIKGTSVEETEKRTDDLRTAIGSGVDLGSLTVSTYYPNNYCFDLPVDYEFFLGDEVTISYTDANGVTQTKRVGTTPTTADRYSVQLRNPFSEHNFYLDYAEPLRLIRDGEIVYITDGNYTITKSYLTYLKQSAVFSLSPVVNIDLPEHTHMEIVNIAAKKMFANIESPSYQTMSNEVMEME